MIRVIQWKRICAETRSERAGNLPRRGFVQKILDGVIELFRLRSSQSPNLRRIQKIKTRLLSQFVSDAQIYEPLNKL